MTTNDNNRSLKVVIVEDEPHSRESLRNLLRDFCPETEVVGWSDDVDGGMLEIQNRRPDLLFLDIEMPGGTGFDLLERVTNFNLDVIFTTAFEHYALKAIKFSALDYLLKPIDVDELKEAVRKVRYKKEIEVKNLKLLTLLENMNKRREDQTITLSVSDGLEFIRVSDIFYCEANGSYTQFHLKNRTKLLVSKHLKEYEHLLSDCGFYRAHNSYLVNLSEIKRYVKSDGGYLVMNNGDCVSISGNRKETLIAMLAKI